MKAPAASSHKEPFAHLVSMIYLFICATGMRCVVIQEQKYNCLCDRFKLETRTLPVYKLSFYHF